VVQLTKEAICRLKEAFNEVFDGFRSEQAFLIVACENELERGDSFSPCAHTGCPYELAVAVRSDLHD
jgi:hypothetical protein